MVAPTWLLMSSPTIGTPASVNFCAHSGLLAMNTGIAFDEADAGVDRGLRVVALRVLGTDRQVRDEHVALRVAQRLRDVDRRCGRLLDDLAVVLAETVEGRAALHEHAELGHVGELDRVVDAREDRLAEVDADLLGVDVEGGDELDVADVVAAELDVHEAGDALVRVGVAVELDALHEAARAVPDPGDGDADGLARPGRLAAFGGCGSAVMRRLLLLGWGCRSVDDWARSSAISSSIHSRSCWVDRARCSRSDRV